MSYSEPSKDVVDLMVLNQDLFEIKRIQASLSQLPCGNLRTSLEERVALYLSSGETMTSLMAQLKSANKNVKAMESRISQLEQENALLCEGRELVSETVIGFRLRSLILMFIGGWVLAYVYLQQ